MVGFSKSPNMKKLLPFTLILFFALYSCEKDPSTFPAKVKIAFGMIPTGMKNEMKEAVVADDPVEEDFFVIDDGTLVISSIDFEGRRQDASDVFFTADFDPPIVVNLKEETSSRLVQFDIPQGIFERIEFTFHLGAAGHIPLIMNGEANLPILGNKIVRFEYQYSEAVKVLAQNLTGNRIVLRKDVESQATVFVNSEYLFRLINPGMLITAEIINEQGNELILIAQGMNTPIFNVIANRLSQSFEVIFE
jgi:hypothetical protein